MSAVYVKCIVAIRRYLETTRSNNAGHEKIMLRSAALEEQAHNAPLPISISETTELITGNEEETDSEQSELIEQLNYLIASLKAKAPWQQVATIASIASLCTALTTLEYSGEHSFLPSKLLGGLFAVSYAIGSALMLNQVVMMKRSAGIINRLRLRKAAGPIALALNMGEQANAAGSSALLRLLPELHDLTQFDPQHRAALQSALQYSSYKEWLRPYRYNPSLALTILETLARIGEVQDLAAVEVVMQRNVEGTSHDARRLYAAADLARQTIAVRSSADAGTPIASLEAQIDQGSMGGLGYTFFAEGAAQQAEEQLKTLVSFKRKSVGVITASALGALAIGIDTFVGAIHKTPVNPIESTLGMCGLVLAVMAATRGIYAKRNAIQALMRVPAPEALGALIEVAEDADSAGVTAAEALVSRLQSVTARDKDRFSQNTVASLLRGVRKHHRNKRFVIAVLHTLGQVGGEESIQTAEQLAQLSASGRLKDDMLHQAATDCLAALKINAASAEQSRTLLRASTGLDSDGSALLRPASSSETGNTAELLRPLER